MAEAIVDGRGSGNYVGVDNKNRMMVVGSIVTMPTVSISAAADPATTEIGTTSLGSASLMGAYDGVADVQALRIVNGSHLLIAGSISSIPSVNVTAGSQSYMIASGAAFHELIATPEDALIISISGAMGSVGVTALPGDLGSVVISSSSLIGVSGAIFDSGDITGSVVISSAPVLGVSGDKLDNLAGSMGVTALPGDLGSVVITSSALIGVSGLKLDDLGITTMPTVTVDSTALDIRALNSTDDSVRIIGSGNIGSVVISSAPLIGISGLIFTDGKMTGSFHPAGVGSVVIQSSNLIGVSGLIFTGGDIVGSVSLQGVGSVHVANNPVGSESYIKGGSVSVYDTYPKISKQYVSHVVQTTGMWVPQTGSSVVITDVLISTQSGTNEQRAILDIGSTTFQNMATAYLASNGGFVTNLQTPFEGHTNGSVTITTTTVGSTSFTITGYEVV